MGYYVLEYAYGDLDKRAAARPDHLAYLTRLQAEGRVVLAGPVGDGAGALVVLDVADEAEAEAIRLADPYTVAGVAVDGRVRPWRVVVPEQ